MRLSRLMIVTLIATIVSAVQEPASAFVISTQYPTITFTYEIRPEALLVGGQALVDSVEWADNSWQVAGAEEVVNAVHCDTCTDIRYVDFYAGNGAPGGN